MSEFRLKRDSVPRTDLLDVRDLPPAHTHEYKRLYMAAWRARQRSLAPSKRAISAPAADHVDLPLRWSPSPGSWLPLLEAFGIPLVPSVPVSGFVSTFVRVK